MYPCVYSKDKKKHKKWIDGYITYNNDIIVLYTEYKRKIISKIIKIKDDEEIRIGFYYIYTDNLEKLIENNYNDNDGKMDDDKIDDDKIDNKIDSGKGDNNININNHTNNNNHTSTNINNKYNKSVRKGFFSAYKRMKGNDEINNNDIYNNNNDTTTNNNTTDIVEEYKIKKRTDEEILKLLE